MTAWRLASSSGDASQSRRAHLGALELIKRAFIQWFVWGSMLANNSVDCRLKAFHLRIDCPHISSAEARHWSIDLSQKSGLSPASLLASA